MDYPGSHHLIFGVTSPGVRDSFFPPRECEQLLVHNGFLVSKKACLVPPFWLFSSYLGSGDHIERISFSFADLSTCSTFEINWWRWVFLGFTTETSAFHPGPSVYGLLSLSRISERPLCLYSILSIKEESWPEYSIFPSSFRGWPVLPVSTHTWGPLAKTLRFYGMEQSFTCLEIDCWRCIEGQLVQGLWYISPTSYLIPRRTRAATCKNLSSLCRRGGTFHTAFLLFLFLLNPILSSGVGLLLSPAMIDRPFYKRWMNCIHDDPVDLVDIALEGL